MALLHPRIRYLFKIPRILTMALVDLLFCLESGNFHLTSVDDNNEVTSQHMRHIRRPMLSHKKCGNLGCKSTENLTTRVDNLPVAYNRSNTRIILLYIGNPIQSIILDVLSYAYVD